MPNCAVATCGNYNQKTKGANITYHTFPKDPTLRKQWIDACKRSDKINIKHATVCSAHFTDDDYLRDLKSELLGLQPSKILKSGAVPTSNLSGSAPTSGKAVRFPLAPYESIVETHFIKCEPDSCDFESSQEFSTVGNLINIKVEGGQTFTDDGVSKEIVKVEHEMQDVMEEAHNEEHDLAGDLLNETHPSSAISEITLKNNLKTKANEINWSKNCWNYQLEKHIPECEQRWQHFDISTKNKDQCTIINGVNLYSCDQCSKVYRSQKCLKQHSFVHSGVKPYFCNTCQRSFASKNCLGQHALVHSGERPYSCNICLKSFSRHGNLKEHILTHSRLKPYVCQTCSRAFTKRSTLQRHLTNHDGDRPYACPKCSRMFRFKCTLDRHLLVHTKENYSCSKCSTKFTVKCSLSRHLRMHSDQRHSHVEALDPVKSPQKTTLDVVNISKGSDCGFVYRRN